MKKDRFDVIVIGAGASGLMAAIAAARAGKTVLVLDHHSVPAKKILATGNGKCNFTNKMQGSSCYRCDDPAFVLKVLTQFNVDQTLHFFENLGVRVKERQGYCYPRSGQAAVIRNALLDEVKRLHIKIRNDIGIRMIQPENNGFCIQTKSGDFFAKKCILAAGGNASPKTGSDGSGYIYAKKLGHTVTTVLPALVPLISDDDWLKETSGVRADARVTLLVDDEEVASDTGELQMTDYGVSGIPVFQVSRFGSKALQEKRKVDIKLDFLPDYEKDEIIKLFSDQISIYAVHKNWEDIISGFVNQKISSMICHKLKLSGQPLSSLDEKVRAKQLDKVISQLKETRLSIIKTKGFDQAQVTCGGIDINEIDANSMESKLVPGLYFAGEIIDVDGICGGYNLQWAWSSGYCAGIHSAK